MDFKALSAEDRAFLRDRGITPVSWVALMLFRTGVVLAVSASMALVGTLSDVTEEWRRVVVRTQVCSFIPDLDCSPAVHGWIPRVEGVVASLNRWAGYGVVFVPVYVFGVEVLNSLRASQVPGWTVERWYVTACWLLVWPTLAALCGVGLPNLALRRFRLRFRRRGYEDHFGRSFRYVRALFTIFVLVLLLGVVGYVLVPATVLPVFQPEMLGQPALVLESFRTCVVLIAVVCCGAGVLAQGVASFGFLWRYASLINRLHREMK